ncbi:vomeronasal 1 receptor cavPorV1R607 [Cavia porcellus]|uniref:vomeronasal 1 receptor cavPorV1R607 n=1 Tax=Cavia porcellus TaxID=10141 RepID=UPI0001CF73FC|nr:vomeronasal 1 receptor cavPorV1R607 [Cavia porcellus]
MNINSTFSSVISIQHLVFFEITIGIIANVFLLILHVLTFLLEHKSKPIDLTIGHLALIHIVMLTTVSFIAIDTFGYWTFKDVISCTSVIYLNSLMRDLSICSTCLLSVLQAITVSPRSSCVAKLKRKSLHHNLYGFLFFWVFNMFNSGRILISTVATPTVTSHGVIFFSKSCSLLPINPFLKYMFFSLMTFNYVSCIGLMVLSSGYMVILLCKHKKQSQYLHSTSLSPKASPEKRAIWTILLLMSFFIVFYSLDCVFHSMYSIMRSHDQIRHCVLMLVGNGYATICPLVLISSERQFIKCFIFISRIDSK